MIYGFYNHNFTRTPDMIIRFTVPCAPIAPAAHGPAAHGPARQPGMPEHGRFHGHRPNCADGGRPGHDTDRVGFRPTRFNKTEDKLVIETELPGYAREDMTVEIEGSRLIVSATRKTGDCEDTYRRSYRLNGIDKDAVTASLKDGLLTLVMPFVKPEKKQIEIG